MTPRPDNRLRDAPLVPVTCGQCGAAVQARKSSWAQTSVQWDAEAMARCVQRRVAGALAGHAGRPLLACSELRASIEAAAIGGAVPVLDEITAP